MGDTMQDGQKAEQRYKKGEYLAKNPDWHTEDSPWKADHILNILENNDVDPQTVCEVGCGAGEILNQLHKKMSDKVVFTGYDISPQAIDLAKEREKDRLSFKLEDLLEDEKAGFDVVMAIDVFEHVEDYYGFLRKLKNKGEFKVFHIPLDLSVQSVWRAKPIQKVRADVGHIHYFTKETALAALEETGYEVIDYAFTGTTIDLPAQSFRSRLARLPRKLMFSINKDLAVRLFGGFSLLVIAK